MLKRFAVMGNPIAHSLSPFIHQRFAEQAGIALSYEKILVPDTLFESQVLDFFAGDGKGLNITLPFKQRAFAMAEGITARCKLAKAANTLWLSEGKLQADNTDGIGLIRDLASYGELAGKQVLLLGAGGAARGIIGPLLAAELAGLTLVNRNEEKAKALQTEFTQLKISRLAELKTEYDLIINATSASLAADSLALPQSLLKSTTLCYDLAYSKTGATAFVAWAVEQGVQAADGLGMLVEQAAEAFLIWHGVRPDARAVLTELKYSQSG
ncbi:Shikimate dehydrogenase [Legionella massiliensis]|uniref:Shikimate dehydrogenase (NADP(+)) n=1 Tax=Legionella massiliensis TaxID=1034943 RepID=A0A078KSC7_9GAMM|nr:shikimate dehydrogenase [Legionella massiliensis]CDZ75956.1 Shikimate dehydrogenase [Legionella massiliensis]CEE11694.1 Shikimate dehydrogenase [Legionella massiliensis]